MKLIKTQKRYNVTEEQGSKIIFIDEEYTGCNLLDRHISIYHFIVAAFCIMGSFLLVFVGMDAIDDSLFMNHLNNVIYSSILPSYLPRKFYSNKNIWRTFKKYSQSHSVLLKHQCIVWPWSTIVHDRTWKYGIVLHWVTRLKVLFSRFH